VRTSVIQAAVAVANFALASLREVEDADAKANVVQDAVRVLFVQLGRERARDGHAEVARLDRYRILRSASARAPWDAAGAHLEHRELKHHGGGGGGVGERGVERGVEKKRGGGTWVGKVWP
jgi:hypothetical protein